MDKLKRKDVDFPLVSVVIPVYNVEKYIRECLESVIHQTYYNLEIILVDDGSSDTSGKICDEYAQKDSRIKVIHKENGGVSSARNSGLDITMGEWINFIDPDDWIALNTLELALKKAEETQTDMCFFDYKCCFKDKQIYKASLKTDRDKFIDLDSLETFCRFSDSRIVSNYIVKRNLVNGIRFDINTNRGEDMLFKISLYKNLTSFSYLKVPLYYYRMTPSSSSASIPLNYQEIVYKHYYDLLKIFQDNKYPNNAEIIANSTDVLRSFPVIVELAFHYQGKKCNYSIIRNYINSSEFKKSLLNYDKKIAGKTASIYLLFGRPNRVWVTFLYQLRVIFLRLTRRIRE